MHVESFFISRVFNATAYSRSTTDEGTADKIKLFLLQVRKRGTQVQIQHLYLTTSIRRAAIKEIKSTEKYTENDNLESNCTHANNPACAPMIRMWSLVKQTNRMQIHNLLLGKDRLYLSVCCFL